MNSVWPMPSDRVERFYKVVVCFERRLDGGLRAWSEDVPGFVLSHRDVDALLADIKPALDGILSDRIGGRVVTEPLDDLRLRLEDRGIVDPPASPLPEKREYVAHCQ